jgi:tetratricopeptide (TPR) repeat protein
MNRAGLLLACVAIGSCASALRPVDTDSELGRARGNVADPAAAARLMERAAAAFAERPDMDAVHRAEELWRQAALTDAGDSAPIIGLVRTQVWLTRHFEATAARRDKATEAVATAQWCARREPADPACPYWLAIAVGVQTDERRDTAADGLEVMERSLRAAIERDESTDSAGPHRVLATLLLRAPGWPTGPGDPDAALPHAQRAVELFDAFAPNWLALGEALRETEQPQPAANAYACALQLAEAANDPDSESWQSEAREALAGLPAGECSESSAAAPVPGAAGGATRS